MLLTKEFAFAKSALDDSQVIAFPTETVMGLGIYFDDFKAYELLNKIKERPEDKPYTLMLGDIKDIEKYAYITSRGRIIIDAFMPGPVTLLLKSKESVPGYVTHNTGVIGVRVPDMELVRELLKFLHKPLLVPSANKSGKSPALTSQEVIEIFGAHVKYVFAQDSLRQKPSTIIDLTGEQVKILREGPISINDINKVLKGEF